MTDNTALIAELTRVKVLFQARAIAAAMGVPPPKAIARFTQARSGGE